MVACWQWSTKASLYKTNDDSREKFESGINGKTPAADDVYS